MKHNTQAYQLISQFYEDKTTKRSKVPLINHINEGLIVIDHYGASEVAKDAYCLHPLLQDDINLQKHYRHIAAAFDSYTIMLAMEYRNIANTYLVRKLRPTSVPADINLSPIVEVNLMLIADKVQNKKDFETYHKGLHPNSDNLEIYFDLWLERLGISDRHYEYLCKLIDESKNHD